MAIMVLFSALGLRLEFLERFTYHHLLAARDNMYIPPQGVALYTHIEIVVAALVVNLFLS